MAIPGDDRPDDFQDAPARLRSALEKLQPTPPFIPKTVDEVVLKAARERLQPQARRRPRFRFRLWVPAMAVVLLLLSLPLWWFKRSEAVTARHDVNHDGQVNVLDALWVARQVDAGNTHRDLDFNQDGVVNLQDAASIAAEAVRLDKPRRS